MTHVGADRRTVTAAIADAAAAVLEFDDARRWLADVGEQPVDPFAAEVWVFDESLQRVVLVRHRWRGWVAPGGRVEGSESPRTAATRELAEETGIVAELLPLPAAVFVRSYRSDWSATLGFAYAAIVDASVALSWESHQPGAWMSLERDWDGAFPEDRARMRTFAALLIQHGTGLGR
ncbi:NUDIX domain-containing protein [Dactylosporangium siamense]|uniref:Nudix hydrolase domain-containing protein n=1 Tax=Dactylosporangium siamense TaxID=685454 RepID=A0A919PYU1_9ACTN|nr:NUDIX hydrolase [Dactylosporangium siamense]GIG52864.1 hypothetical protein Dsi01nite_109050 [Dactylosporangium siamense]